MPPTPPSPASSPPPSPDIDCEGAVRIGRIVYSDKAQADLEEIWDFIANRWGVEQADRYLRLIDGAAGNAATGRLRSRPIDFVSQGLRKARCVRHFLYFRCREGGIGVERGLHDRMDETLHLI